MVLCHVGHAFANVQSLNIAEAYGYAGVSFFFMLSGFVLAWSDPPQTARRFWWQRFARIWPLQFLLMIFAYTAIAGNVKSPGPLGHVAELFLLQAWFPGNSTYAGGNGVTWSLSVEMFFVFPLRCAGSATGRSRCTWCTPRPWCSPRYGWWFNYGGLRGAAYLLAFLALALAVSAARHYLVEKPVERRLRRMPIGQPRTA